MFQFAFDGVLFRFAYRAPTCASLFELPPWIAGDLNTAVGAHPIPVLLYYVIYVILGGGIPLLRFAQFTLSDKWFARRGAADAPGRIRRRVAQRRAQSAHKRAIVRGAAADRVCRDAVIKP